MGVGKDSLEGTCVDFSCLPTSMSSTPCDNSVHLIDFAVARFSHIVYLFCIFDIGGWQAQRQVIYGCKYNRNR